VAVLDRLLRKVGCEVPRSGQTSKRWLSVRDTYAVQVAPGENDLLVLASVLALDLAEDAERRNR
jgi:uncharacterized protein YxjI